MVCIVKSIVRNGNVNGENMVDVRRGLRLRDTAIPAVRARQAAGWTEQSADGARETTFEWRATEAAESSGAGNEQLVYRLCELISMRGPAKTMAVAASPESYTYYLVGEISWLGNIVFQVAATFFMPLAAQNWFIAQFHSWCSAVLDLLEECEMKLWQVEQDLLEIRQSIGSQIDLAIHVLGSALVRGPKPGFAQEAFDDHLGGLRNSVRIFIESYHIAIGGQ